MCAAAHMRPIDTERRRHAEVVDVSPHVRRASPMKESWRIRLAPTASPDLGADNRLVGQLAAQLSEHGEHIVVIRALSGQGGPRRLGELRELE